MPDKLTDKEIVKALECVPSDVVCNVGEDYITVTDILDLINRQQAENEKNENIIRLADKTIETANAEIKRLSTLAELGNMRANDYRAMRDRALKAEKEVERLKEFATSKCEDCAGCTSWKCDCANVERVAYEKCIEKVEKIICDNTYPDFDKDGKAVNIWKAKEGYNAIDNLLKELVGDK